MKREIKVIVNGEITEEIKNAYHERFARYLVKKFGAENCLRLVEVMDRYESEEDKKKLNSATRLGATYGKV